ncbi:MAG: hypothetical protein PHE73_09035, partial [Sulfurovaceae bacterium]|nr:hypothetical protein [Sulfurovaceae bacterium]
VWRGAYQKRTHIMNFKIKSIYIVQFCYNFLIPLQILVALWVDCRCCVRWIGRNWIANRFQGDINGNHKRRIQKHCQIAAVHMGAVCRSCIIMSKAKTYQPFEVGRMSKAKRIKIAKMLQDAWK